jgi:hypothetical protein
MEAGSVLSVVAYKAVAVRGGNGRSRQILQAMHRTA